MNDYIDPRDKEKSLPTVEGPHFYWCHTEPGWHWTEIVMSDGIPGEYVETEGGTGFVPVQPMFWRRALTPDEEDALRNEVARLTGQRDEAALKQVEIAGWGTHACIERDKALAEVARLTSALAGAFTVAPLDWSDNGVLYQATPIDGFTYAIWNTPGGLPYWFTDKNRIGLTYVEDVASAKAACEADWRQRITAALVPAASPEPTAEQSLVVQDVPNEVWANLPPEARWIARHYDNDLDEDGLPKWFWFTHKPEPGDTWSGWRNSEPDADAGRIYSATAWPDVPGRDSLRKRPERKSE